MFFDTETVGVPVDDHGGTNQVLQFGCAERVTFNKGSWSKPTPFTFHTVEEFWDYIESQSRAGATIWVMAHNLGGFDLNVLGGYAPLVERGWEVKKAILNCPPFVVDLRRGRAGIRLIDSLNFARMSLADIGKNVGVPKAVDPGPDAPFAEREAYCQLDVKILRTFILGLIGFCQEHDLGNFGLTMASIAMHAWRHRFAPTHVTKKGKTVCKVFPTTGEESAFERRAYMAGRTEAFHIGPIDQPVWAYDVHSMFPSVMRDCLFPYALHRKGRMLTLDRAHRILEGGYGLIAQVTLETDKNWYPQRAERIVYPVGRFETYLCTPELQLALKHGHVVSIGKWQSYRMVDLFSEYVNEFYRLRQVYLEEGNSLYAMLCKVGLLNSLYGKFGQKIPEWEDVTDLSEAQYVPQGAVGVVKVANREAGTVVTYRCYGGKVERLLPESRETASGAFVAIAAHVTSNARVRLLEGIEAAGAENVFYTDTDSAYVNEEGHERLEAAGIVHPTELGKWGLEKVSDSMVIWGAKDYVFMGERKIKGVRRQAEQVGPSTFVQDKFRSFRGNLYHGTTGMLVLKETKTLTRIYQKGVVANGGRVHPFLRQ